MDHSFGPYLEIARIQSEMNKLFDVLLVMKDETEGGVQANAWIPNVDVCQTAEGLIVRAEVPGVAADTLKLSALGGALIIQGERPRTKAPAKAKFQCMERIGGKFRRVVPLGTPINTRDARASIGNGILEVFFPRVSNRRGEEVLIPVTVMEEQAR